MPRVFDSLFDDIEHKFELSLSSHVRNVLIRHLELVVEKNKMLNLTRITDMSEAMVLHVEDSLSAFHELASAPEGRYCDIGTGAGFPGVPLAVVSERPTLLDDSSKKKAQSVREFVRELNLDSYVSVSDLRAEDLAREQAEIFSAITMRAVAQLPSLIELACPLLSVGGLFIALKANPTQQEIISGNSVAEKVGMRLRSSRKVILGNDEYQRLILTYEKIDHAPSFLPRRNGLAQKRPLA